MRSNLLVIRKDIVMMLCICATLLFGYHMTGTNVVLDMNTTHTVTVQQGDTIWDIASRVSNKDVDIRQVIFAMKYLNKIEDSGALVPGTILKIPTI